MRTGFDRGHFAHCVYRVSVLMVNMARWLLGQFNCLIGQEDSTMEAGAHPPCNIVQINARHDMRIQI